MTWITAAALASQFRANEVAADQEWKGRWVRITGAVESINKDAFGEGYIVIEGDRGTRVQCGFGRDTHESYLANLSRGEQVSVTGMCRGLVLGTLFFKDCRPAY